MIRKLAGYVVSAGIIAWVLWDSWARRERYVVVVRVPAWWDGHRD